jgi:hypothetical protein
MAWYPRKIDAYEVRYSANQWPRWIALKAEGEYIGQLMFEYDGTVLPPFTERGGSG